MLDYIMILFTIVMVIAVFLSFLQFLRLEISVLKGISIKVLALIVILYAGAFGSLIVTKHYSVDSFNLVFDLGSYWQLQLGRYLNCGLFVIVDKLGFNPIIYQLPFAILWYISLSVTTLVLYVSIPGKSKKGAYYIASLSIIPFANVFMMEWMLFPEMFLCAAVGLPALTLSIYFALKSSKSKILSLILLIIALGNYQSYIGIFLSFSFVCCYLKYKANEYKRYKEYFWVLCIGGGASLINVSLVKILVNFNIIADSGRGSKLNSNTVINNLKKILSYQVSFWKNSDGLIPMVWMIIIGAVICFFLFHIFSASNNKIELLALLSFAYILSFAPHIIESNITLSPRSNIAIWSTISCIMILAFNELEASPFHLKIAGFASFFILGVNVLFMNDIATNTRAVNCADFLEAKQICTQIKEYERKFGVQVNKIAVSYDENPTRYQPFSKYKNGELGARILATDYSGYRLISYELGESLEKIPMEEEIYNSFFKDKDWSCFDAQSQIKFKNNIIYLVIY